MVHFLSCFSYLCRSTVVGYRDGLCPSESELCNFFLIVIIYSIVTKEAALSRSNLNTLHKIAFNSFFLHLFATQSGTNESWIMCEYAHRISALVFLFLSGFFFHHTCSQYRGKHMALFTAIKCKCSNSKR